MRKVRCKRCQGEGWVAMPPAMPANWMPTDPWPEGVHGWNPADCPTCRGTGEVLSTTLGPAELPRPATASPAAAPSKPTPREGGGLFNA